MAIIKDFIEFLECMKRELDECGSMTLGLEDQIGGLANDHEGYYYLLKQRACDDLTG
jgi:hypothetical protein